MAGKEQISDRGLLFGSNSLYEVLREIAARKAGSFHGAALAAATGRSRKQVQSELAKLRTLGVVEEAEHGHRGRRHVLRVADTDYARHIVELPKVIDEGCERARTRRMRALPGASKMIPDA